MVALMSHHKKKERIFFFFLKCRDKRFHLLALLRRSSYSANKAKQNKTKQKKSPVSVNSILPNPGKDVSCFIKAKALELAIQTKK